MSRSQALSLRCAEPGGKSQRVQIQSLTTTSGRVLCEAPTPQGLLPPSHHIWEVGCSISTRDWVTPARTMSCSTRDFARGHRRQDWRRGPFRGGGWEHRRRRGPGGGSRRRSSSATWPALQPPETSRGKNQTQTMFEGTVELVKLVPAQITSGNPFTPAFPPLLGRPSHQAGQSLI